MLVVNYDRYGVAIARMAPRGRYQRSRGAERRPGVVIRRGGRYR
jgi:hypothetical protein